MDFSVTRSKYRLIRPSEKTPLTTLDLSALDKIPVLRCNARTMHVYKYGGHEAAPVIKDALSRALVPYYPLAGRLKESSEFGDHLQVECSEQGVWFVEASTNCTLDVVNFFDNINNTSISFDNLLPTQFPETESSEPLVQMQVTEFACGGFVIGLVMCHAVTDGLGAAQFLKAIGELARGLEQLSVEPVWYREFFSKSPSQEANYASSFMTNQPPMPNYKLEQATIDISIDEINNLKQEFEESTGQNCSTFEVIAAIYWKCRTKAIGRIKQQLNDHVIVTFVFFANCRQLLDPPLPQGFYGNCFFPVTVTASTESLATASYVEVVKLIQESKAKLPIEFGKYVKGGYLKIEDPFAPPIAYTTLFLSEWGRLGFNDVDYGWGPPVHVVPIQGSPIIPASVMGFLPSPNKGVRLMSWCVKEAHRQPFIDEILKLGTRFERNHFQTEYI